MTGTSKTHEIRARHPFPWRDEVHAKGQVKIIDANGAEVGLFDLVAMAVLATMALASQQEKEKAA